MQLNERETATVISALRDRRQSMHDHPGEHSGSDYLGIPAEEIDSLCERINTDEPDFYGWTREDFDQHAKERAELDDRQPFAPTVIDRAWNMLTDPLGGWDWINEQIDGTMSEILETAERELLAEAA